MLVLGLTYMQSVQSPERMSVVEVPLFANDPWHGKQGMAGEACLLRAGIGARTQPAGWGTLSMIA